MKTNTIIASALALAFGCCSAFAQQAIFGGNEIVSPQRNENGTVTFRCFAPGAGQVLLTGDMLPTTKAETPYGTFDVPGVANLTKGENGIWEYTTPEMVSPELYTYNFIVDGSRALDMNNVWVNRDVATLTSVLLVPGERAELYDIKDVPHGTVSKRWYESKAAGFSRRISVYTPAGYEDSPRKRYPVVYVLHGVGGDEDAWLTQGRAAQILDNLIAQGKAEPMIAVFTNGNISQEAAPLENSMGYTRPTMALPRTMDGVFEEAFPEIVKFVDSNYRTIAKKQKRAICGLSMGGFHSLHISLNYPDMFNYTGLFSAAISHESDANAANDIYKDFDGKLARYFEKNPKLFWIGCGDTDFLYNANVEMRAKLDSAAYPYTYMETSGGHIWRNWRIYLSEYLPLLFKD